MDAGQLTASPARQQALGGVRQVVADYVTLTKPKVQSLLLFTTVCAMYVAGDPSAGLVLATVTGGYLSAGGAGAINHWYDRDVDLRMGRTANRPVASGRVSGRAAVTFGLTLIVLAMIVLTLLVNPLAAGLSLPTLLYQSWQEVFFGIPCDVEVVIVARGSAK